MNFFNFNRTHLGVDIGSRTLKGVQLKKKGNRVYLDKYFFHDLAKTTASYPEKCDIENTLKAAIELERMEKTPAATSLKDHSLFAHHFKLPILKESEMKLAVAHELSEQSIIPIDDLYFDYLSRPIKTEGDPSVDVRAYGVKKELVAERLKLLQTAKLKPKSIESEMLAITAMLDFNDYIKSNEVYAVFDMGESYLTSGLVVNKELKLTRSSEVGSGEINRALKKQLNMDYSKAEQIKVKYDFKDESKGNINEGNQIVDDVFTKMFQEIVSTLNSFKEYSEKTNRIDRILLVGGGSQVKNITRVYEMLFKIPTTMVNPFRNIEIYSNTEQSNEGNFAEIAPYMSNAVGLALHSLNFSKKEAA